MSILSVQNLTKSFGTRTIINDLSFTVDSGMALAITGKSGSGKSTILNMLGLLDTPDSGHITLDGITLPRKINSRRAMLLRRKHISYLFQSFALIPEKSALANILLGLRYAPGSKTQKITTIKTLLERLEIAHLADQPVKTLSGGEQQRVALARCILKPGQLILADEPTGALDKTLALQATSELLELQKTHGKTLIMVTHDLDIAEVCDAQLQL